MSETFNIGTFNVNLDAIPDKNRAKVFQSLVNIVNELESMKVQVIKACGGVIK